MKFRIGLKDAGLTALGVVLLLLLYCFASNGRYERVEGGVYGGYDAKGFAYGRNYYDAE